MAHEYWTDGGPLDDLRAALAWSPWPSWVVAIGGVVAVVACGWLALETVRETRQS